MQLSIAWVTEECNLPLLIDQGAVGNFLDSEVKGCFAVCVCFEIVVFKVTIATLGDRLFLLFNVLVYAEGDDTHFASPFVFLKSHEFFQCSHRSGAVLAPGGPEGKQNDLAVVVADLKRAWLAEFGKILELSCRLANIGLAEDIVFDSGYSL